MYVERLHLCNCLSGRMFSHVSFSFFITDKAHICHTPPSTCPEYSNGICDCPDCTKKLIPPHLHSYCKYVKSGGTGGEDYQYSEYSGEECEDEGCVEYSGGTSDRSFERDGDSQGASRIFKPWLVILTGSLVAAAAVGVVMHRRVRDKKAF